MPRDLTGPQKEDPTRWSTRGRWVRSVGLYGSGSLAAGLVWVLVLPLLTARLTPDDLGVYGAFRSAAQLAYLLMGAGGVARVTWSYLHRPPSSVGSEISATFALATTVAILLLGAVAVTGAPLDRVGLDLWPAIAAVVVAWCSLWARISEGVSQMEALPRTFLGLRMVDAAVFGVAVVGFLLTGLQDWRSPVLAYLLGAIAAAIIGARFLNHRRLLDHRPTIVSFRHILSFGGRYQPHAIALWSSQYLDRYLIAALVSISDAGLYVVSYSIAMALGGIHEAVAASLAPKVALASRDGESSMMSTVSRIFYRYAAWGLTVSVVLVWPLQWIATRVLGDGFAVSVAFLPLLVVAQAMVGISRLLTGLLFSADLAGRRSMITVPTAAFNAVCAVALIRRFGTVGAAYATLLTFTGESMLLWYIVVRAGLLKPLRRRGESGSSR